MSEKKIIKLTQNPASFGEVADELDWYERWDTVQSGAFPDVTWFEGNYSEYEVDFKKRKGDVAKTPTRVNYKKLA